MKRNTRFCNWDCSPADFGSAGEYCSGATSIEQVMENHQLKLFNSHHFTVNLSEITPVSGFIKTIRNFIIPSFSGVRIFRPLGCIIFKSFPSNRTVNMQHIVHNCISKKLVSFELYNSVTIEIPLKNSIQAFLFRISFFSRRP